MKFNFFKCYSVAAIVVLVASASAKVVDADLNEELIKSVQDSWAVAVEKLGYFTMGDNLFKNYFETDPYLLKLFTDKSLPVYRASK